jgi:hypothetical protein
MDDDEIQLPLVVVAIPTGLARCSQPAFIVEALGSPLIPDGRYSSISSWQAGAH